jgi:glycine oxidase
VGGAIDEAAALDIVRIPSDATAGVFDSNARHREWYNNRRQANPRKRHEETTGMIDVLIVGGGVIGLSLAYELAGHGRRVRVVERGEPGREASWAGAGILPPGGRAPSNDPPTELLRLSNELHDQWSHCLRQQTGVDNGFRRCGGIYLAFDDQEAEALRQTADRWQRSEVSVEALDRDRLAKLEPALASGAAADRLKAAWWLPEEAQLRNPRHLQALVMACGQRGVCLQSGVSADDFRVVNGRIAEVLTSSGPMAAEQVCLAGGPWTRLIAARLGFSLGLRPVRGQMVLLRGPRPVLRSIINEGSRYLVPRSDGRVLVGSTEEEAGFDKRTTASAIGGLLDFAVRIVPDLGNLPIEKCWAGLRPGTVDRLPYLGRLPGLENAFVATGHFRSGLQLAPGTAAVMARLMQGLEPGLDLRPFRVDR